MNGIKNNLKMNMKGLRYLILNIIKFLLFIFLKKNNMNEKKEDYGNFSHGLSNTIKINISPHLKDKSTIIDKNENEKKISIVNSAGNNIMTQNYNTLIKGNSTIQNSEQNNIISKENNNLKEIEFIQNKVNINNLNSLFDNNNYNPIDKEMINSNSKNIKSTTSKVKFHEFFINNNKKNKGRYNHQNNKISTTKYNFITFIPKSLLIQFARLPNIYFLSTAIIQSIPLISPLTSITAIVPLLFVLSVSMIRDLIEDLSRLTYDRLNNNEEVFVFRDGKFINSVSSSLNVGELILVFENNQIPSDMIIIDSSLNDGMSYVETSSLDGEKNLKPKIAYKNLNGFFKNNLDNPDDKIISCKYFYGMNIEGFCQCDFPNPDLHKLDGRINISLKIKKRNDNNNNDKCQDINNLNFPINQRQMLLKGSVLCVKKYKLDYWNCTLYRNE